MIFILIHLSACWKYATFDELEIQCAMCNYITNRFINDTTNIEDELTPVIGSICYQNESQPLCQNLQALASHFKTANNKTDYCLRIGYCPKEVPAGYTGQRCRMCMMLTSHLLDHSIEDRRTAFHKFCLTNNYGASVLCNEIIEDNLDDFLDDLEEIRDSFYYCRATYYCKVNRKHKSKSQDEL